MQTGGRRPTRSTRISLVVARQAVESKLIPRPANRRFAGLSTGSWLRSFRQPRSDANWHPCGTPLSYGVGRMRLLQINAQSRTRKTR